jgi:hypothetical protein
MYDVSGSPDVRGTAGAPGNSPVRHKAEEYLDAFIEMAGLKFDTKGHFLRLRKGKSAKLTNNSLRRENVLGMVKQRARAAGLTSRLCNHSYRATGIAAFIAGGKVDKSRQMAAQASTKTTELYNRTGDDMMLDEAERIAI